MQSGCAQVGHDVSVQEAWCTVYHSLTLHSLVSGSVYKNVRIKSAMNYLFNEHKFTFIVLCSVVFFVVGSSALFWLSTMYFLLNRNICVTNFCVVGTQHLDVKKLSFIIWWWCLWRHQLYIDFFMYTVKILIKFYIRKLSQCNDQITGWLTILFFPPCSG